MSEKEEILKRLRALSDEDRAEVLSYWCPHCGSEGDEPYESCVCYKDE